MSSVPDTNTNTAPIEAVTDAFARWKKTVEAELKGAPFDKKLVTRTFEGVALQPLYTRADLVGLRDVATQPGQAPFLRGKSATGYKARAWEIAQEIAASTPKDFNAAVKADLMRGQDSVVLSESLPVSSLADLRTALDGVALDAIPAHLEAGADALPVAALYVALAEERKVPLAKLTGSVAADPLSQWVKTGHLPHSLADLYTNLAEWTRWASQNAPALHTIGVNARVWGDAGANAVQELAFALAEAAEYLRALQERNVSADVAGARVRVQFAVGPQFFTEIAKFRAWRSLWTRVLVAFGAAPATAAKSAVHAATGRWNKTLLDPHVNMLRVTTEALSAVLGGCDSLHIAPFDEVTGSTDDFSRRIARNVHTVLAEEFSFTQTADPAGGSWYVEKLTDELAHKAWELFQSIEAKGGYAAAVREGFLQKLATDAANEKTDAIGKRRLGLIGTNLFPNLKEKPLAPKAAKPAKKAKAAKAKAAKVTAGANWSETFASAVKAAAAGTAAAQLTVATSAPEAEATPVAAFRASAGFETLRAASDAYAAANGGKRPRVFLAKMGPVLQHKARADFSAGFFAPGGFEIVAKQAFDTPEAAAKAAAESGAAIAVLCSTDDTYPTLVPAFAAAAKAAKPDLKLVLAGLPAEKETVAAFRAAGIDEFIHIRASVYDLLANFLKLIGALK
ncbi:methylmalonyl-CoA mutase family protein [Opitutus sp. ER46]|uniref:methylmalonyl-CoA mutase family protein n=1 Tax=Opitutus sp. ER46 TaxID=2161864 RepID=UPI000D30C04B|nr:methylmalonyl-CoA mutase family protein [Opitutus sp. ER46]PTX99051.1 methylmalonyl-CoA mutase [Opitutus sp. ER46]